MKIITVNLPRSFLKIMESMIGNKNLYPSRSELIRVAIREFLISEIESVNLLNWKPDEIESEESKINENQVEPPNNLTTDLSTDLIGIPWQKDEVGNILEVRTFRIIHK